MVEQQPISTLGGAWFCESSNRPEIENVSFNGRDSGHP
jgi:hypothetical protein